MIGIGRPPALMARWDLTCLRVVNGKQGTFEVCGASCAHPDGAAHAA